MAKKITTTVDQNLDPFAALEQVAATELQSTEVDVKFMTSEEASDKVTRPLTGVLTFRGVKAGIFRYTFTGGSDNHLTVYNSKVIENLRLTNHRFRVSKSEKDGKTREYCWYE